MHSAENLRFFMLTFLLAGTGVFLSARNNSDILPGHQSFAAFPQQLGNWEGRTVNIEPDVRKTLGPGDFLLRDYQNDSADGVPMNLLIAYFPTQRAGDTFHSPRNCLPGNGWQPLDASRVEVTAPGVGPFIANRYLVEKGSQRGLVYYWYLAHGRAVASEYWAKFYLVEDSIRLNRSDGSLIRITTEIREHETVGHAQNRVLSFLTVAIPQIDVYVPR